MNRVDKVHIIDSLFEDTTISKILSAAVKIGESIGIDRLLTEDFEAAESLIFASWVVMAAAEKKYDIELEHRMPGIFVSKSGLHVPTLHADRQNLDGSPKLGCEDFDVSAVLYLNQEFNGGELVFADTGNTVKPSPGRVVIYGGGIEFAHYVGNVYGGDRWACPMWFSMKHKQKRSNQYGEKYRG